MKHPSSIQHYGLLREHWFKSASVELQPGRSAYLPTLVQNCVVPMLWDCIAYKGGMMLWLW